MIVLAKKEVLVRQVLKDGKRVDIKTKRGQKIDLNEEDAIRIWGALDLTDEQKKKLLAASKLNGYRRRI